MSTTTDLMGLGMPGPLASRLGYNPTTLVCTGTAAGTAATMTSKMVTLTAAASQTGAIIPSGLSLGGVMYINTDHATTATAVVYPPSGATIDNGASFSLAQDKAAIVWRLSATKFAHVILA